MDEFVFAVVIDDGLQFGSGNIAPAPKRVIVYCRVPKVLTEGQFEESTEPRWVLGMSLTGAALEGLYEALYGEGWRYGNGDGSTYVVLQVEMRAHRTDVAWEPPAQPGSDASFSRHYFLGDASARFHAVTPGEVIVPAR
jgi:hypothetical protein